MLIQYTCLHCSTVAFAQPYRINNGSAKYCSRQCARSGERAIAESRFESRFWSHVDQSGSCWKWIARRERSGYGQIQAPGRRGRQLKAHKVAWWLATGYWPSPDEFVCHVCDDPPCVRNDDSGTYDVKGIVFPRQGHLFLAGAIGNARDMSAKGRDARTTKPELIRRGELHHNAKLTTSDIVGIRIRAAAGESDRSIASDLLVTPEAIAMVRKCKNWAHVV